LATTACDFLPTYHFSGRPTSQTVSRNLHPQSLGRLKMTMLLIFETYQLVPLHLAWDLIWETDVSNRMIGRSGIHHYR
jgi:hypothetical protein